MQQIFEQAAVAIFTGEPETFAAILTSNPDVAQHQTQSGHPNLLQLVACEEAKISNAADIAKQLIEAGSPTAGPLVAAAGCGSPATLTTILDHGVDIDGDVEWTALDEAIYWDQTDMVRLLVERGASQGRLRRAAGVGDVDAMQSFFSGSTLTESAGPISSPFSDTVDEATKADPQTIIDHAFVMAVNNGFGDAAEFLLDRGARLNATPPGYHWRGTALHAAIWRGSIDLVSWLLDAGADPTIRDGFVNSDALGWARYHEHPAIVELLAT